MAYFAVALACAVYAWIGMWWGQRIYRTARRDRTETHAMAVAIGCGALWPLSITFGVVGVIVLLIAAGRAEE